MVLIILAAWCCTELTKCFGVGPALVVWSAVIAVVCLVGTWLLMTSTLSRITWKNRLAGVCIPWGSRVNRGLLWPIPVVSGIVWMLIGTVTVLLFDRHLRDNTLDRLLFALFVAWIVDGAAMLYLLGTLNRNRDLASKGSRTLLKLLALIAVLIVASGVLFTHDQVRPAVIIAGGPPLFLAAVFGLFFGVLILFGRNARWN